MLKIELILPVDAALVDTITVLDTCTSEFSPKGILYRAETGEVLPMKKPIKSSYFCPSFSIAEAKTVDLYIPDITLLTP